ncbi:hypothetical protein AXF14_01510 [Actinomyces radicidentis]|uniref:Prevent-host-death protein n=1 Tax=Actinomyces radicidentis TaxID=111015 RepID=A0A0X8JDP5_ACTRD|nr:DUF5719 family protein [Actinomyces radicidentis]AMD86518.1 hypothetical protein AXF14_01510 [Actinomyces radicidentis]
MTRLARAARRTTGLLVSAAAVVAVGGLTWWGALAPRATSPQVEPHGVPAPASAVSYVCPAGPSDTIGAVTVGKATTSTAVTSLNPSGSLSYDGETLTADPTWSGKGADGGVIRLEDAASASPSATASASPTAGAAATAPGQRGSATGVVTSLSSDGDLRGLTTASCTPPSAVSWIVGGSAAVGSSSELRLTNPGSTSVTARVTLLGSTGELTLPSGGVVAVPAGETRTVLLETASDGSDRVAVGVEAEDGALGVSLATESLDGETPAGTEVMTPGAAPSTDLTVPGVLLTEAAGQGQEEKDGATSSDAPAVRVANPGSEPATVTLTMEGEHGSEVLPGAESVTIDPGAVFDVSLAGVDAGAYGVHVTSDQPVAAAVRLVRSDGQYPEASGALVHDVAWAQAGEPSAVRAGSVSMPRSNGMSPQLLLGSSGDAALGDTTVHLTSADGSWSTDVDVPAGTTVTAKVPDDVDAVTMSGEPGRDVTAAVVVTATVKGDAAGTLISALTPVADSQALAERRLRLG